MLQMSQVSLWLVAATRISVAWSCYVAATESRGTAQQMGKSP